MLNMASHDDFFSTCPGVSPLAEEHPVSMLLACWNLGGQSEVICVMRGLSQFYGQMSLSQ